MIPSVSRPGRPYDNAYCESFLKTLKREEIHANDYRNLEHLFTSVEAFIEQYYNRRRLHSALGYRPPEDFETEVGQVNSAPRFSGGHHEGSSGRGKPLRLISIGTAGPSVNAPSRLIDRCVLSLGYSLRISIQPSFWLTNKDLSRGFRIEFIGVKDPGGELCQSSCLTEGFRGNRTHVTVPIRIVRCHTYRKDPERRRPSALATSQNVSITSVWPTRTKPLARRTLRVRRAEKLWKLT
jgi:hypothetical protein